MKRDANKCKHRKWTYDSDSWQQYYACSKQTDWKCFVDCDINSEYCEEKYELKDEYKNKGVKIDMSDIKTTLKMEKYIQIDDMYYFIPTLNDVEVLIDDIDVNFTGNMMEISKIISYEEFIKSLTEDEILSIESQDNQIIFNIKTDKKFI